LPTDRGTVFLDRDGTINVKPPEGDYVKPWDEFEFLRGAATAVRELFDAGLRVVIVTNQRGIARGLMKEEDLADIHARMVAAIGRDVPICHCPHDEGECDCRKP
jgi:histidinol-phosphate phosphatase family protein